MRPDCQLRTFNADVINSSIIILPPCPYSCPPTLVLSFAMTGRAALDGVPLFPFHDIGLSRIGRSSTLPPSSFGPSLVILGCFPPQLGPWAYYPKWAGVPRSFGPTITNYIVKVIQNIYDMTKNVIG